MPITYTYECRYCGEYEVIQGIKEETLQTCWICNSPSIQRLITTAPPVAIYGKGVYKPSRRDKDE